MDQVERTFTLLSPSSVRRPWFQSPDTNSNTSCSPLELSTLVFVWIHVLLMDPNNPADTMALPIFETDRTPGVEDGNV